MKNIQILMWIFILSAIFMQLTTSMPQTILNSVVSKGKALNRHQFHQWMRDRYMNLNARRTKRPISFHGRADDPDTQTPMPSISKIVGRAIYLGIVFLPALLLAGLAVLSQTFRHQVWFPLVVRTLAKCGAAFIKWGQWASTRPDMFPESLCAALAPLTHMAPSHGWKHTKEKVERELGCRLEDYFESFDRKPLASGSVAQVYRATVLGHPVAVKVTHPHVAEQISLDFRLMSYIASIVDSIPGMGWLNLRASMDQFSHTMAGQARLDVEADHLELFNQNFRTWKDTQFPVPLFKSQDILIESYEEGILVSSYSGLYKQQRQVQQQMSRLDQERSSRGRAPALVRGGSGELALDPALAHYIVTRGEHIYLKMLLVDNLMHADLHPGNILVRNILKTGKGICVLDAGMVAKLTADEQRNFIGFIANLAKGNGEQAAKYLLKFSTSQTCSEVQRQHFIRDIQILFSEKCRGYGTGTRIGEVLCGALTLIRKHQVRIDANYATLVMNILCLDGLSQDLEPEYNIVDGAKVLLRMQSLMRWPAGRLVFRVCFPIAEMLKKRADRKFWKQLQKTRRHEGWKY